MASFGKEILSGPLEKKAKHFPFSWQKRHFLLDERSLTYYSGAEVHTYQLRDFQDVLRKGKGEFEIVFSGTAPEVFPELRLHVRCAGGDDAAREWADAIAGARRNLDIGAALAGASIGGDAPAAPAEAGALAPPPSRRHRWRRRRSHRRRSHRRRPRPARRRRRRRPRHRAAGASQAARRRRRRAVGAGGAHHV